MFYYIPPDSDPNRRHPHAAYHTKVRPIASPPQVTRRLDLRDGPAQIYSIDPPGCKAIDDALHARDLGGGLYEVGLHALEWSLIECNEV